MQNKRAESKQSKVFHRHLFPITIITAVLISGSTGYLASQLAISKSDREQVEINELENKLTDAKDNSVKVIETELPKILSDLDEYNQDIDFLLENVEWLNDNLAPIKGVIDKFDTAITIVKKVNTFVNLAPVSKMSTELGFAQIKLGEMDSLLFRLENLTEMKQEMNDSHQKLNVLFEEYQKEQDVDKLFQMEQELNTNLIFQIENLRHTTIEAHKVLELSSSVLITVNKIKSLSNSIQEMGEDTLDAIQFWKDNEKDSEMGSDINESLEEDIGASIDKIQKLPDELTQRSKGSITSISIIQKELQTLEIAQMISSDGD